MSGSSKESSTILLYLAKPKYGGWVSFTAHLALKYQLPLYKISKTTEKRDRPFGYDVDYRNINQATLKGLIDEGYKPVITAIDKSFYDILPIIPDSSFIVIHDPTEFNKAAKKTVLDNLERLNVITIRPTVHSLLEKTYGIQNTFIPHPYVRMNSSLMPVKSKGGAVSISRIDYDKNIDIIVKANSILPEENRVEIFGEPNELYIYRKLKEFDSFKKDDPNSMYRGSFARDFELLKNMLNKALYVVDMSTIHLDGGGTQYTFLEAIDAGCVLILNNKWVSSPFSIWKDGHNCIAVSNENELAEVLSGARKYNLAKIQKEALKIMDVNENADWSMIL